MLFSIVDAVALRSYPERPASPGEAGLCCVEWLLQVQRQVRPGKTWQTILRGQSVGSRMIPALGQMEMNSDLESESVMSIDSVE